MDLEERRKWSFCSQNTVKDFFSALQLAEFLLIYLGAKQMNTERFPWASVDFIALYEITKPVHYSYFNS